MCTSVSLYTRLSDYRNTLQYPCLFVQNPNIFISANGQFLFFLQSVPQSQVSGEH